MQVRVLPILHHDLVALRPLRRSDAAAWHAYLTLPEVFEHTSWNLRSVGDLASNFDSYESADPASQVRFAIVMRSDGALAGTIGFHTISRMDRTAEIAYDLAPAAWGKGIAAAACQAAVKWAYAHLGLLRVQATVLESNLRSMRVLEKCGFEREGYLRCYRIVRGRPGNFWMYSRLDRLEPA
jgi:[ribosomal protein S5]-alanine N-acetyltransferase